MPLREANSGMRPFKLTAQVEPFSALPLPGKLLTLRGAVIESHYDSPEEAKAFFEREVLTPGAWGVISREDNGTERDIWQGLRVGMRVDWHPLG